MAKQIPVDITVTKHGDVAVLKMSGTVNCINMLFCKKWHEALDKVESWPDVKALISTGSGKFYCNGLDLKYVTSCNKSELGEYTSTFESFRRRLLSFPMVTIAAINGHGFAGGVILALLHDYRVMHDGRGWLCLNEVDLGIRFPTAVVHLLQHKCTPNMIRDVAIFGNRYTARQALDMGLIDEIAAEGKVVSKAIEMAKTETHYRNFNRDIVQAMKMDMYYEAVFAQSDLSGIVGKRRTESKL